MAIVTTPFASRLRHDFRFALVKFRVQYDVVFQSFLIQQVRKALGFFNRRCAHQHGLAAVVEPLDLVGGREVFFFLGTIDDIGIFDAQQRAIRRYDVDFQAINLAELLCFGFRGAGHAGELFVHAEIILERDGGERLIFALDLHIFLGFDCLVQSIGPAAPRHQSASEFVDDNDFPIFHDVFNVPLIERVRLDRSFHVMLQRPVFRVGDVADAEQLLNFLPPFVGDGNVAVFLIDHEVFGVNLRFARLSVNLLALLRAWG